MISEVWLPIAIENCLYQVSTHGKIKTKIGHIMKPSDSHGYEQLKITVNEARKTFQVHTLVALTFLFNIDNKKEVNHIDGNKKNNMANNLEWVTRSENATHSIQVMKKTKKTRALLQYNEKGEFIKRFESVKYAIEETGISQWLIRDCANKKDRIYKGFMWAWEKEIDHDVDLTNFVDIPEFGKYMISKKGEIYSKCFKRLLVITTDEEGYKRIILLKIDKIQYQKLIHRLLAEIFIPNPYNLPVVNHKDGDKNNNDLLNLEWVSLSENSQHAVKTGLIKTKPVEQWLNNVLIKKYTSVQEAHRETKLDASGIVKACKGVYKTVGGYTWKYSNVNKIDQTTQEDN